MENTVENEDDLSSVSKIVEIARKQEEFCDLKIKQPIRINRKTVYRRYAPSPSLILRVKFDNKDLVFDYSGNKNHGKFIFAETNLSSFPNIFESKSYVTIKDFPQLSLLPLTFSFQLRILSRGSESSFDCPILIKGNDDLVFKEYQRFPSIYLQEKTRQIVVSLTNVKNEQITMSSLARLKVHKNYLVVLQITEDSIELFINGILDSMKKLTMITLQSNNFDLFIGSHPTYLFSCKIKFSLEQLEIHSERQQQL